MKDKEKLIIIDGDYIPYKICYNKKESDGSIKIKEVHEIYSIITFYIHNLLEITEATKYIGYLSPKKTFRNDINSLYKANRKPSEINYLKEAKLYLEEKYKFNMFLGLESDDCCLITENLLKDKYDIIIVSPDKDVINTCGKRYNSNKQEFSECNKQEEELFFWKSMICGDAVDGIKGLPGKGIKYAENLFERLDEYNLPINKRECVFNEYIFHFGEYKGIEEFFKNYMSLYILREREGFIIPELQEFKNIKEKNGGEERVENWTS